jgi:small subunit ribosomal protein S1
MAKKSSTIKPEKDADTVVNTGEPQTMEQLLATYGNKQMGLFKGQTLDGKVISVTTKEILVDVGAKSEGVVSGRELDAVRDMLKDYNIGDTVAVTVIQPENDLGQVMLSLRQASGEKRWQTFYEKYELEEPVEVKGIEVNKGGLIVELDGIRGFIPSSQFSALHLGKIQDLVGKMITAKVIEVDKKANRLVLSEKAMHAIESQSAMNTLGPGQEYEGIVSSVLPFGVFVNINGAEGLVHVSEISWEKVNNPADYYKQGDKVKVAVISVDPDAGKLNLSIKQLQPNPWREMSEKYSVGDKIKGTITKSSTYGVFVKIDDKIEGLIHNSKITNPDDFAPGKEIEVVIESLNPESKRIALAPTGM